MSLQRKLQFGFGHIVLIGAIVVIAAVAFAGWKVMDTNNKNDSRSEKTSSVTPAASTPINSGEDLNAAGASLDQASVDSDLDSSALDSDVNSLL